MSATNQTKNLAPTYERRLIEAGMPAQGSSSKALARAIARWDAESIPMNPIERRLYSSYIKYVRAAELDRSQGAIAA